MNTHPVKYDASTGTDSTSRVAPESEIIDVEEMPTKPEANTDPNGLAFMSRFLTAIGILWLVVAAVPWPAALDTILSYAQFSLHVLGMYFAYELSSALRQKAWPWVLLSFIPILNLAVFCILILDAKEALDKQKSS